MVKHTIPELHNTLEELSSYFKEKTIIFCQKVGQHDGEFTHQDHEEFTSVIEDIK
jgi:hypothetical protein